MSSALTHEVFHEAKPCIEPSVKYDELSLMAEATSWLACHFLTREHWYRWFASFLNEEYHSRLFALSHLSICNLDQIEGMLANLFAQEYERVGRCRRISDLPERNTDWGITYSNSLLPVPLRYHVISQIRTPDKTVWAVLLNLAHTLLRYHKLADSHSSASQKLQIAYQKVKPRFPGINASRFIPWPHDLASRLAMTVRSADDKVLIKQLLHIQRKWHQRLTEDDVQKLLSDMLRFGEAFNVRDGKGKAVFHLFEMVATVTVIRAAVSTGWKVRSITSDSGRHPQAVLEYTRAGRTSICEVSKEADSSWDRSIGLKRFLNGNSPGFMPDIVLRFWRNDKAVKSMPDFWAFADAKRNEVTSSYISTSIDKAITYAASLGGRNAWDAYTSDFQSCASYPLVTLFFYSACHPDYRVTNTQHGDNKAAPLVVIFNISDMKNAFGSSRDETQLHAWFEQFNRHLGEE